MSLTILARQRRLRHLLPEARELRITGFQSPAEDEREDGLSLDRLVDLGAPHIWPMRLNDDSALGFGLYPGDRLLVDRAATAREGQCVIVDIGEEAYRVRLLTRDADKRLVLVGGEPGVPVLLLDGAEPVEVWGVVQWIVSYVGGGKSCPYSR